MLHYPNKDSGKNISPQEEPIAAEDPREAWEIAHLPGVGAYALDSWRIFCRDSLRGRPSAMLQLHAKGAIATELDQEWATVLPTDKELRAYLRWRWLRLGFLWDSLTGETRRISPDIVAKMESKELRGYHGFRNPWLYDFMATEQTPDWAGPLHGNLSLARKPEEPLPERHLAQRGTAGRQVPCSKPPVYARASQPERKGPPGKGRRFEPQARIKDEAEQDLGFADVPDHRLFEYLGPDARRQRIYSMRVPRPNEDDNSPWGGGGLV